MFGHPAVREEGSLITTRDLPLELEYLQSELSAQRAFDSRGANDLELESRRRFGVEEFPRFGVEEFP